MEGLQPIYRRVAGIDVHRMLHVVTVVIEQPDGAIDQASREFGGFKRDCRALAAWLLDLGVELVVMESTGIYWKVRHEVACGSCSHFIEGNRRCHPANLGA